MSITNRLKSYRSSAAKTVGAAAALAVFAGLLTPTSVSATTQNAVDVQMYVVDNDTVQVCINFDDGYGIPSYVFTDNGDHFGDPTDVREYNDESNDYQYINNSGLSIDWDHTGEINEDFEMSFIGFDESVETDADYVDCELVFEVDNLDPFVMWDEGNQLNFEYSVWLEEEYTDGVNTGTSAYRTDFDDSWAVHNPDTVRSNYIDTAVGLANSNDAVTDERHTAFFCINDYWATDDWDGIDQDWWGYSDINELPTIRVWDDTEGAYVDSEDGITINNYWSDYEGEGNFPSNNSWEDDCNDGYETGSLIGGLTLGHTYVFEAITTSYKFEKYRDHTWYPIVGWIYDDGSYEDYNELQWIYAESDEFTPLDVRQNQSAIYEQDYNEGCDGPDCYDSGTTSLNSDTNYRGDSPFLNNQNYTNVDIILPENLNDESLAYDYMDTDAEWTIIDDQGNGDYYAESYGWSSFADINGGVYCYYGCDDYYMSTSFGGWQDETVTFEAEDYTNNEGNPYAMQQNGLAGNLTGFYGQAFVDAYMDDWDGIFQGLSDSFSTDIDTTWYDSFARATSDTSVALDYVTNFTMNSVHYNGSDSNWYGVYDVGAHLDPNDATYFVKAVPNYGNNGSVNDVLNDQNYCAEGWWNDWCDNGAIGADDNDNAWDGFSGNESNRPNRFGVVNYVFSNDAGLQSDRGAQAFTVVGDTWYQGNYWNGSYNESQYRLNGVVQFDLNGLQPGTTYSIEVRAVANVQDTDDLYTYWNNDDEYTQAEAGDGGWTNAQTRQGNYGHATTYLSAAAQNVTRNSAEVAVNLQNSHLVDSLDAQKAGYVAINKCTTYEEEGYYYECDNYVSNVDNDFEEEGDYSRFAMPQISRYPVTQTQYVDGQLSAIVNMTQLTENTKYEVVFGMDYWPTTNDYIMWDYWADEAIVHYGEASNRKAFDLTLDGSYCDGITSPSDEANCYNGAQNNDLFRTGVVSFITGNDNGIAPALTDYAPGNYDEEVATDSDLELTFSEDVLRGNVGHTIKVYDVAAAKVVYTVDVTSASVAGSGNSWTVDLPNLAANSQYTITIEAGTFVDSVGNPFAGQTINFITEGDTEAPTLDSITTVSSQEEGLADVDTTVTLNFSEDIVAGTSMIEVRRSSDSKLIFSVAPGATKDITIDGSSATISLPKNLDYSTEYYVYVPAGAFSDVNGNAFAGNSNAIFEGDSTTAFTTQSEPSFLGTIVIGGEKNNVRSYTVNYGKANAYLSVKLYWLDPHVNRYRYMTTIFLDANGYAKVNVTHFGINQFDIVKGRVGNHWTSSSRAWIA